MEKYVYINKIMEYVYISNPTKKSFIKTKYISVWNKKENGLTAKHMSKKEEE